MKKHIKFLPLMGIIFALGFVSCNAIDDAVKAAEEAIINFIDTRGQAIVENTELVLKTTSDYVGNVAYDYNVATSDIRITENTETSKKIGELPGYVFDENTNELYEDSDTDRNNPIFINPEDDNTFPDDISDEDKAKVKKEGKAEAHKKKGGAMLQMHTQSTNAILFMYLFQEAIKNSADKEDNISDYEVALGSNFASGYAAAYTQATGQAIPEFVDVMGAGQFPSNFPFPAGGEPTIKLYDFDKSPKHADWLATGAAKDENVLITAKVVLTYPKLHGAEATTYGGDAYKVTIDANLARKSMVGDDGTTTYKATGVDWYNYTFTSPMTNFYDYSEVVENKYDTNGVHIYHFNKIMRINEFLIQTFVDEGVRVPNLDSGFFDYTDPRDATDYQVGGNFAPMLEVFDSSFERTPAGGYKAIAIFELRGILGFKGKVGIVKDASGDLDSATHPIIATSETRGFMKKDGTVAFKVKDVNYKAPGELDVKPEGVDQIGDQGGREHYVEIGEDGVAVDRATVDDILDQDAKNSVGEVDDDNEEIEIEKEDHS